VYDILFLRFIKIESNSIFFFILSNLYASLYNNLLKLIFAIMSTDKAVNVNPYEILQQRRKLKNWKKTTPVECMKILKKVRDMQLENSILIATEIPRTLIYVANRTRESQNEDIKKMNKMCRFLAK